MFWSMSGRPFRLRCRCLCLEFLDSCRHQIIEGKGATNYAVALAVSRIVASVLRDERRVLRVSTLLHGWQGIDDGCLSVPTVVHRGGTGERLAVSLSDDEHAALTRGADQIRSVARSLGF